jgi:hypothetical protein
MMLFRDGGNKQLISNGGRFKSAVAERDKKQTMIDLREISSNWFKTEILKRSRRRRPCILRFSLRQGHQSIQSARLPFQSSELGPPAPTRKGMLRHTRLRDGGGGGENSDEATDTLALFVHICTIIPLWLGLCSLATTIQHNFSIYSLLSP